MLRDVGNKALEDATGRWQHLKPTVWMQRTAYLVVAWFNSFEYNESYIFHLSLGSSGDDSAFT